MGRVSAYWIMPFVWLVQGAEGLVRVTALTRSRAIRRVVG